MNHEIPPIITEQQEEEIQPLEVSDFVHNLVNNIVYNSKNNSENESQNQSEQQPKNQRIGTSQATPISN